MDAKTKREIKAKLGEKTIFKANGRIRFERGYFYHHGMTCEGIGTRALERLGIEGATIADSGDEFRAWPGRSYMWVEIALPEAMLQEMNKPRLVEGERPRIEEGSKLLEIVEVDASEFPEEDIKKNRKKSRVYFHMLNENILENLCKRFNRPAEEYRKLLPEALRRVMPDIDRLDWKALWSQKAGCSCGCSPGFILEGIGLFGKDIHIDVRPKPEMVAEELKKYEVADPTPAPGAEQAQQAV